MSYVAKIRRVEAIQYRPHENCAEVHDFLGIEYDESLCLLEPEATTLSLTINDEKDVSRVVEIDPEFWIVRTEDGNVHSVSAVWFEENFIATPDDEQLPCGCLIQSVPVIEQTMLVTPCSDSCATLQSTLKLGSRDVSEQASEASEHRLESQHDDG